MRTTSKSLENRKVPARGTISEEVPGHRQWVLGDNSHEGHPAEASKGSMPAPHSPVLPGRAHTNLSSIYKGGQ